MFEKLKEEIEIKADEYALEESTACDYGESSRHVYRGYFYGFQKGAEFGYNKANEWHYVKDGKFPTHSNRVLVFTDEGVGFGLYGLDDKKWHTYDTGFDVIAWKEIVLPELPGEN